MSTSGDATSATSKKPQRFVSIDALRGFDMFCILGAGALARSFQGLTDQSWAAVLHEQLEHVPWDGFHFYDLIFPLFVFLMGVSTVFSLDRVIAKNGEVGAYVRIFRRGLILYLLGIFYHGHLGDMDEFRFLGVLHRIAICYVVGGVLYVNFRWRGLLVTSIILLAVYWGLMSFVPVPGHGPANFDEGTNLANYVDSEYLPGYKWDGDWDPEGLLSTIPAVVSGLLGIFAGLLLRNQAIGGSTSGNGSRCDRRTMHCRRLRLARFADVVLPRCQETLDTLIRSLCGRVELSPGGRFPLDHRRSPLRYLGQTVRLDRDEPAHALHAQQSGGWLSKTSRPRTVRSVVGISRPRNGTADRRDRHRTCANRVRMVALPKQSLHSSLTDMRRAVSKWEND